VTRADIAAIFVSVRRDLERVARRIVRSGDIDDIVQETFVRSYEADLDRPIRHPRAFMLKTARNLALNHVDLSDERLVDSLDAMVDTDFPARTPSLERQVESRERFLMFCRAVRELPLQCRRAFILKKVYGLSQKEIAEYLGISESTVEKHVAKGILGCWTYLEVRGLAPTLRTCGEPAKAARGG
jgi:RNA polymerase sigma-70 factor (ECF subfamily)